MESFELTDKTAATIVVAIFVVVVVVVAVIHSSPSLEVSRVVSGEAASTSIQSKMITTVLDVDRDDDDIGDGRRQEDRSLQHESGFVRVVDVDVDVVDGMTDGNVVVGSDDVSFVPLCSFESYNYHHNLHNGSDSGETKEK